MSLELEGEMKHLNNIRESIESMPKFNQVEVLRILSKNKDITLNENKYRTHINLTDWSVDTIEDLKIYINYVTTQELNLNKLEKQKEDYKNNFFQKDNKDN